MNKELHDKIFARMDELGAIRKDLTFGCIILVDDDLGNEMPNTIIDEFSGGRNPSKTFNPSNHTVIITLEWAEVVKEWIVEWQIIGHLPVLSDCMNACWGHMSTDKASRARDTIAMLWDCSKPYLIDQSDELGEKLYSLIK